MPSILEMFDVLKQMGRLREESERLADELKKIVVEGSSGGGMVTVRMNGKQELLACKIDPQALSERDAELLEDLLVTAFNQALEKSRTAASERTAAKVMETVKGLNLRGLTDLLGPSGKGTTGT